jgi:hypothetical protein
MNSMASPISCWSSVQQLEDLGLDHHVERRGGLVRDDQARGAGERHRDHHALLLPARQLMRIVADAPRRQTDLLEQVARPHDGLLLGGEPVDHDRLGQLVPIRWTGLSACIAPWNTTEAPVHRTARQATALHRKHVLAVQQHLAGRDGPGGQEPQDRVSRSWTSRSRTRRQAEDLALLDVERDPPHRRHGPRLRGVGHLEVADRQDAHR